MAIEFTEDQLHALGRKDKRIAEFNKTREKLASEMRLHELCHRAESFGRPGSMTESGKKYSRAALEMEVETRNLLLYMVYKGHIKVEDLAELFVED